MKSGTNWLCNLLNHHRQISCVGEFHWERVIEPFVKGIETMIRGGQTDDFRDEAIKHLQTFIRETIVSANRDDVIWCGDRTPGKIDPDFFPPARYFHIIRDGRDVLVSRAFHLLRRPETTTLFEQDELLAKNLEAFQQDPNYFQSQPAKLLVSEELVRQTASVWARVVRHNQQIAATRPDVRVFELRYEKLHADTENIRSRCYEFLELDPNNASSLSRLTQPGFAKEQPDKFFRKGAVGDWTNYFSDEIAAWFDEASGGLLDELGYRN